MFAVNGVVIFPSLTEGDGDATFPILLALLDPSFDTAHKEYRW